MDLSELLDFNDLRTDEVYVPQWKQKITVQEQGLEESMVSFGPDSKVSKDGTITLTAKDIARVVAFGVIDPKTGDRVFSDKDIPTLARKNRDALTLLYHAILSLSGLPKEAEKN